MNRLLMIAFHYPPFQGSSGVLRTWSFTRYLQGLGWSPSVLTANARAYPSLQSGAEGSLQIPPDVAVRRAFGLDAARHFALRGRYPRWLALPDRWISWYPAAVLRALRIVRIEKPKVIWSTYPIATAHLVAHTVQRRTGLPWVADFRDSMTEEGYPSDRRKRAMYQWIERQVIRTASAVVFTTEGARKMYVNRYPDVPARKFHVIANGYDEESFVTAELQSRRNRASSVGVLKLLHSGVLYPSERDPMPLFAAISRLRSTGVLHSGNLQIILRSSGHDELISGMLERANIGDIVKLAPAISYGAALSEMLSADALLLMQAANSNHQIPAKLYEYLRAARPILGLTDIRGDTAGVMREAGVDTIADIADAEEIAAKLPMFLERVRLGSAPIADREFTKRQSREARASQLADLLERTASSGLSGA